MVKFSVRIGIGANLPTAKLLYEYAVARLLLQSPVAIERRLRSAPGLLLAIHPSSTTRDRSRALPSQALQGALAVGAVGGEVVALLIGDERQGGRQVEAGQR